MPISRPLGAAALSAALVLAACGGGGGDDSLSKSPPPASDFPAAGGRPLLKVLAAGTPGGPVVSPNAMAFTRGPNRVSFGVFTTGREEIDSAEVALYAAHGPKGKTTGPYPARIEDLTTEQRYRSQSTAADPDAAHVVYSTEIPFDAKGEWRVGALIREGETYRAALMPSLAVGANEDVPKVGKKAPLIHTPTGTTPRQLDAIDTRRPHDDMHKVDYASAFGRKPIVLLFATPALCQSRVCGPVVDEELQVRQRFGDQAEFLHMEIYNDNDAQKGVRPQLKAFNLPSEPWLFAIDKDGIIRARIEGAFGVKALEQAVQAAIDGKNTKGTQSG